MFTRFNTVIECVDGGISWIKYWEGERDWGSERIVTLTFAYKQLVNKKICV